MTNQPQLIAANPAVSPASIGLAGDGLTIGRAAANTVCIPEDSISRSHARISQRLGLYWIEDLHSTNGTFFTPPGGEEVRLAPGSPQLLVDGSAIRFGFSIRYDVQGTVASQDEATRRVLAQLQDLVRASYSRMGALPAHERADLYLAIRDFEVRLQQAAGEADLARIAAEGIQVLSRTILGQTPTLDLPPLAEGLAEPDSPHRVQSIQNVFITDVRRLYPQDHPSQDQENG